MSHTTFNIHPDERILAKVRKHWFVLVENLFGLTLAGILPFIVAGFLAGALGTNPLIGALVLFFGSLWLLIAWMMMAVAWTNHYLDMWVITERRVVYVEQVRFFVREVTTLPLERIQDATVRYGNFIETVLDFGTLRVQSAGASENDVLMHDIPRPEEVKRFVLTQADRFAKNPNDSDFKDIMSQRNQHE
ncbi:MAG: PH domain-containing protein [Patescibacteria group bacterium]